MSISSRSSVSLVQHMNKCRVNYIRNMARVNEFGIEGMFDYSSDCFYLRHREVSRKKMVHRIRESHFQWKIFITKLGSGLTKEYKGRIFKNLTSQVGHDLHATRGILSRGWPIYGLINTVVCLQYFPRRASSILLV